MVATASADYDMMARALLTMGATDEEVDIPKFSRDLEQIFRQIESIDSDLVVGGNPTDGFQAQVVVDDTQVIGAHPKGDSGIQELFVCVRGSCLQWLQRFI